MKRKIKLGFDAFLGLVGLLGSFFVFGMGIWCLPRHKYSSYEVQRDRQITELGYYSHDIEYPLTEEDKKVQFKILFLMGIALFIGIINLLIHSRDLSIR